MDEEGSIFVLNDETWEQYLEERRENEQEQLAEREKAQIEKQAEKRETRAAVTAKPGAGTQRRAAI